MGNINLNIGLIGQSKWKDWPNHLRNLKKSIGKLKLGQTNLENGQVDKLAKSPWKFEKINRKMEKINWETGKKQA